jgi:hypothetical protein
LAPTLWTRARPAAREAHAKTTHDNTLFIDGFLQRHEGPVRHNSLFLQRTTAILLQNLPEHSDTTGWSGLSEGTVQPTSHANEMQPLPRLQ